MDPFISSEPEEIQQEEIIALKAVHGENFIESPPPKAWKVRRFLASFIVFSISRQRQQPG